MKFYLFSLLCYLITNLGFAQEATELFEQGNAAYSDGKYNDAIDLYQSVLDKNQTSVDLYYNLANAYYKSNTIGKSIYFYEKALQLDPDNTEVLNNLKFAQRATVDRVETLPKRFTTKIAEGSIFRYTFDTWAWLAVVCMIGFVILFILYYASGTTTSKRIFFTTALTTLLISFIFLTFAFVKYNEVQNKRSGIVFSQEAAVNSEPNLRSNLAFELHEGTKVRILENTKGWRKIQLADGKIGWIPKEDIKEL